MQPDHHSAADAIPIEYLGIDRFETGLLAVLRHFMSAYARPESQAWQTAHAIAAQRWGEVEGPQDRASAARGDPDPTAATAA